jgi:hypothetical protein
VRPVGDDVDWAGSTSAIGQFRPTRIRIRVSKKVARPIITPRRSGTTESWE